jgi:hypothetical protein
LKSEARPPLWTWPAALLIALAGTAACWAVGWQFGPAYDFAFLNLGRLAAPAASPPTVVVIGSSRTWCAVEPDGLMSERLAQDGTPARFVRITKGGATMRDYAGLARLLPRVRPAVVVIESDLATLEPNAFRVPGAARYTGWREQSRHGFAALLAPSTVRRLGSENWNSRTSRCQFRFDANIVKHRKGVLAERRASTSEERALVIDLAKNLRSVGVRVVLLDLPNRDDETGRRPAALVRGEQDAMRQLMATGLFDHFADPPQLNPADFEDAGHLDPRGQARTSTWLAARLSATLRTGRGT